jgi:prevent-host-death family protein
MKPTSLKDARERLGALVRAAERGESVVITRRGKSVARIVPEREAAPGRLPELSEFRASIAIRGKGLSKTVVDMRREERY